MKNKKKAVLRVKSEHRLLLIYGGLTNIYPKMLFVNKMFGNINKILYLCTQI